MDLDHRPGTREPEPRIKDSETRAKDLGPRTHDLRLKIQDPGQRLQDRISKTENPDLRPEISDQGLGFILHTAWTFVTRIIFVILKYLLQINTDIYITFLYKKSVH